MLGGLWRCCFIGVHVRLAVGTFSCLCLCSVICVVHFTFNSLFQCRRVLIVREGQCCKIGCSVSSQGESIVTYQCLHRGENHYYFLILRLADVLNPYRYVLSSYILIREGIPGADVVATGRLRRAYTIYTNTYENPRTGLRVFRAP